MQEVWYWCVHHRCIDDIDTISPIPHSKTTAHACVCVRACVRVCVLFIISTHPICLFLILCVNFTLGDWMWVLHLPISGRRLDMTEIPLIGPLNLNSNNENYMWCTKRDKALYAISGQRRPRAFTPVITKTHLYNLTPLNPTFTQ